METQTTDRVRAHTGPEINQKLDAEAAHRVQQYVRRSAGEITRRIEELDREWDTERVLEMNASVFAFAGVVLGITQNKKWLILPGIVLPFLFQHAVQGWCPPLPILRRLGVRSRKEIDREKFALKALRGDFQHVNAASGASASAMQAARK